MSVFAAGQGRPCSVTPWRARKRQGDLNFSPLAGFREGWRWGGRIVAFPHPLHGTCASVAPGEHRLRSSEEPRERFSPSLGIGRRWGGTRRVPSSGDGCEVDPEVPLSPCPALWLWTPVCPPSLAASYPPLAADPALMALAAYSRAGKPLDYPVPSLPSLKALQPQSKPIHLCPALPVTSTLLLVRQRLGWRGGLGGSRQWERCTFEPFGLGFRGLGRSR